MTARTDGHPSVSETLRTHITLERYAVTIISIGSLSNGLICFRINKEKYRFLKGVEQRLRVSSNNDGGFVDDPSVGSTGNRRFISDVPSGDARRGHSRRRELATRQDPFAIILGCSDSRVPAEIIFDQGLGDLFVIRVAGNIVAPSHLASVEFATEKFGIRLVVVLGHSMCWAVMATLEELECPKDKRSPNLCSIVVRIRPSVAELLETEHRSNPDKLIR